MKTAVAIRHVGFEDLGCVCACHSRCRVCRLAITMSANGIRVRLKRKTPIFSSYWAGRSARTKSTVIRFFGDEIAVLERRLAARLPTMGICLGAQLIASSAGARVYPSGVKEIGFAPIRLTDNGRSSCLAPFADEPMTLHWHGDTFDLPAGAQRLASTDLCRNQAFSMGSNIIAFQFHPEASATGFENWLIGHAAELAAAGLNVGELRADAEKYGAELERKAQRVATDWLAQLK